MVNKLKNCCEICGKEEKQLFSCVYCDLIHCLICGGKGILPMACMKCETTFINESSDSLTKKGL